MNPLLLNKDFAFFIILILLVACSPKNVYEEYHENGNLKKQVEINSNEKFDGTMKTYYETGDIESISEWENGVQNGEAKLFFDDGTINISLNWRNGLKDGNYLKQDFEEKILKKGSYVYGKFSGDKFEYDSMGNLLMVHLIKDTPVRTIFELPLK